MRLSYNKLKTFGECALKYRTTCIERLPKPPLKALAFRQRRPKHRQTVLLTAACIQRDFP